MTEDEAKTKRCCGPSGCGVRHGDPTEGRFCIGSACMAWRETVALRPVLDHMSDGREVQPGETYSVSRVVGHNRHVMGVYCGLAGAPQ